jgi:ABC-2 type transport system ATP-binding protein
VRELVDDGTALLLTTQYLEEADRLCDRIVVLARGWIVAEGTPGGMKDQVGGRRVEAVLIDDGSLHHAAAALAAVVLEPALDIRAATVTAPAPDGSADLERALAALRDAGVEIAEAGLRRPTLDDAFLALAGEAEDAEEAEIELAQEVAR